MPPVKRKRCCVPHCPNFQEESKKQFFKIGGNLETKEKWRVGKNLAPKSQFLYCCQDHFDLPNDAVNYIRYKYCPDTKLKLRPNALPHRKLPVNVCRLCLSLLYNGDDMVDVSEKKGAHNAKIVTALLPEIDLAMTLEPVVCMKCFDPLERSHKLKQNVLRNEMVVVNCIKTIVRRSPRRFIKSCEIDLFEEYNDIKESLEKEKEKARQKTINLTDVTEEIEPDLDRNDEEIVIQIEDQEGAKYYAEIVQTKDDSDVARQEEQEHTSGNTDTMDVSSINTSSTPTHSNNPDMQYEIIEES